MTITECPTCCGDGVVETEAMEPDNRDEQIESLRADLTRVQALYTAELDRTQAVLDALGARAGERVDHAAQRVAGELREARERLRLACTNSDVASIVERACGKAGSHEG